MTEPYRAGHARQPNLRSRISAGCPGLIPRHFVFRMAFFSLLIILTNSVSFGTVHSSIPGAMSCRLL